jgi:succinyldiaminopimelate transaminase
VTTAGFEPPPYPFHRLRDLEKLAASHEGGMVDCSVGTPCDPPPPFVLQAMATSNAERGYPESAGNLALRRAAGGWMERRFAVSVDTEAIGACVGTKEFVASAAQYLHLRTPGRDVVLYPAVSYPTYAMGALLAGCRAVPVPAERADGSGLALDRIDERVADRALLLWANCPSNPTGGMSDLGATAAWGRAHGIPVLSDECYCEFTWSGEPRSILEHGAEGVLAVHSLSKRSNLAGVRAGFYAGDPELVRYLVDIRRHAGLMVPGPVQAGAAAALDDDAHVDEQRLRYRDRLGFLAGVLARAGCPAEMPDGGFYLWVRVPDGIGDGWALTEELARAAGLLVSPGEFYGPDATRYVRVAVVQPMERLELAARRLESSGWSVR